MLRAAASAIGFLTTVPVPYLERLDGQDFARASGFYPLAGAVVGLGAGATLWAAQALGLGAEVAAALGLGAWLALTGMLHLDGLLDCADALLASKTPAQRLDILKDVHIGAFGFGVGAATLLLKFALLEQAAWWWPLVAAVAARGLVTLPMQHYPAARSSGLGVASRRGWWPLALGLSLLTLLAPLGWVAWLAALLGTWLTAAFCARRLGGALTGDCYGACIELAELAALLALAACQQQTL